jgi:hypothetical protein
VYGETAAVHAGLTQCCVGNMQRIVNWFTQVNDGAKLALKYKGFIT